MRYAIVASILLGGGVTFYYFGGPAPETFKAHEPLLLPDDSLGGPPLCEASAARLVTLDGRPMVLVGDNEVGDQLFAVPINGDRLEGAERIDLPFPNGSDLEDIEAITLGASGRIEVFGSHSRNKRCELQPERRGVIAVAFGDGLIGDVLHQTPPIGCGLFDFEGAEPICAAIHRGETEASCEGAAFNLEGAVRLGEITWVGLRAPLVADTALLLRRAADAALAFDASATLDLGGDGIRELLADGEWIYGIAGPPADSEADFRLFRFRASALAAGASITPSFLRELPSSSEGLVIHEGRVFVLIDGAEGPTPEAPCRQDARWIGFRLPRG